MMLEDLIGTIQTPRDRIREHRSYFGEAAPEVRTRVSLIANWLYEEGLLTKGEMPFTVGGTWLGVSLDGRRPDGKEFGRSLPVGQTGIKVEGQLSAKNTVRFAIELLKRYGKAPSEVRLRFERTSAGT